MILYKKIFLSATAWFFPQPSYLTGAFKDDGTPNFDLITWITFCSVNPPMLMFESRGRKLTRDLVEKMWCFLLTLSQQRYCIWQIISVILQSTKKTSPDINYEFKHYVIFTLETSFYILRFLFNLGRTRKVIVIS